MKALKSNFYLIKVDNTPVYIGYTNRNIKTRFREHLHDKDFGDGKVTVEELDNLAFPFTWDITLINQYAKEVSTRENELIAEYGTGDSVWQKGIAGQLGGQVLANIKHFVSVNRDNPKFDGVEEANIVELIDYQKKVKHDLQSVIGNTTNTESRALSNAIYNTRTAEHIRLQNVISHTIPKETIRMQNVINNTKPKETQRLKNAIIHTIPTETKQLKDVIGNTKPKETIRLQNIINHTISKEIQRLKDVIGNTRTYKSEGDNNTL